MDVNLLAKMIREIILDNDSVTLPGLGSFVAEVVPATFSDKGYTVNPPYRRLSFSPKEGSDTLLADLYVASNPVSRETAVRILADFMESLRQNLLSRKVVILEGLGRLRATRENNFFFVPDENLEIYPAGFGLPAISLKTHQETAEQLRSTVSELAAVLMDPQPVEEPAAGAVTDTVPEPVPEPAPETVPQPVPEPVPEPVSESSIPSEESHAESAEVTEITEASEVAPEAEILPGRSPWRSLAVGFCIFAASVALLLLLLAVLGRVAPDWIDPLLYSPEELDLLKGR